MPVHAFCSPQKVCRCAMGRSPGFGVTAVCAVDRFTFPGHAPSGYSKRLSPLQWRNRAGLAPDFPVMPVLGTQGLTVIAHAGLELNSENLQVPRRRERGRVASP
jgi:hypothetical protein